ncbi:MAG: CPBP family intramembrane glutamic endopeptidase [Candidatus Hadarchaeales archaeon]
MLSVLFSILRILVAGIILGVITGKLLVENPRHLRRLMPRYWKRAMKKMKRKDWVRLLSTGMATLAASFAITFFLSNLLVTAGVELENPAENPIRTIEEISPFLILFTANFLPIFEEWIFRAVFIDEIMRRKGSKLLAVLVSSVAFSVFHLSNPGTYPAYAVSLLPASLLLAWCYLRAGLGGSIFAHNSYNTLIIVMNALTR